MSDSLTLRFMGRLHECKRATRALLTGTVDTFGARGYYADVTATLPKQSRGGLTRRDIDAHLRAVGLEIITQSSPTTGQSRVLLFVPDRRAEDVTIAKRSTFVDAWEAKDLAQRAEITLRMNRADRLVWSAAIIGTRRIWSFTGLTKTEARRIADALRQVEAGTRQSQTLDPAPWPPLERAERPPAPPKSLPPVMRQGQPMHAAA